MKHMYLFVYIYDIDQLRIISYKLYSLAPTKFKNATSSSVSGPKAKAVIIPRLKVQRLSGAFSGKSSPESIGIFPSNVGCSCKNVPKI